MKKSLFLLFALSLVFALSPVRALSAPPRELHYTDAAAFPVHGQVLPETSGRYTRLPESMHGAVPEKLWNLGLNSAGLYFRFRSNSRTIAVRWENPSSSQYPKLTAGATRGLDLYGRIDGSWWHFGVALPKKGSCVSEHVFAKSLDGQMREYILYLPLYGSVNKIEIGVEEGAVLENSDDPHPDRRKPIVIYGTSILQGACASRPGATATNILSRRLDREVINLGFAGSALLEPEMARWMAACPHPSVFVLDNLPNGTPKLIEEQEENFFRILRKAHPKVPVVFVEVPYYPGVRFDPGRKKTCESKNQALKKMFDGLVAKGETRIYYVASDTMIGDDGEATYDGIHFTDVGMVRYCDLLYPVLKEIIEK
ncbi:MAG: SGNH/GDSL hydrolase family protein [Bacteroidales bacterium]|nr:SGNH/GDSL hydrolase family protein [Bacteroidales bacterium]